MDNNEWEYKHIIQIADPITETVGGRELETLSISAGKGFVNQAEKFGKELSGKQYEKYIVLRKGDFSYNKGNSKRYPQGCIYRLNNREKAAVPNVFESFRLKSGVGDFFEQLFISGYLNKQLFEKINSGVRNDGLLNLNGKDFYSCYVPFPPLEEQEKIAEILLMQDKIINLCEKRLEQLRIFKKACLQKMFPRHGSNMPEIRFPGFTDPWEQRKLGDVFEQTSNLVNPNEHDIELWSLTVEDGLTPKSERYNREFLVKKEDNFKEVRPGDIVYNPMNMTLGAVGYNAMGKSVAVSGYYTTMIAKKNNDAYYINTWLKSPQALLLYKTYATGSLIEKQRVQFPTLSIIPALFPSFTEQQKIGKCFEVLDNLITLHQRKCDLEREKKKALMQLLLTGIVRT